MPCSLRIQKLRVSRTKTVGFADGFSAIIHAQFDHDFLEVILDGRKGHAEDSGYFGIGFTFSHPFQHFHLACREFALGLRFLSLALMAAHLSKNAVDDRHDDRQQ